MFKTNSNEWSDRPAPRKTTIKRPSTICTTYPLTSFLNEMLVPGGSNKCLAGIDLNTPLLLSHLHLLRHASVSCKWDRDDSLPHCTMLPLSTKNCLKSSKLRLIFNDQFCHAISKNICLNVLGSKQPWEILVFVIFKLLFRIICSCSNYLKYMENSDYQRILVDSGSIVHCKSIKVE